MSFDPTSATSANLILWVKGDTGVYKDAGVTLCVNGDAIQQWNDQSGNGHHLTQTATANRPTFSTSGINSLGHVNFVAGNSNYFNVPDLGLATATGGEIFIVIKDVADPPATAQKTGIWTFTDEVSSNNCHYCWTDGIIYDCWGAHTRLTTVNPTPALTSYHVYGVRAGSATWANALDASDLFSQQANTLSFKSSGIQLGRSSLGAQNYCHDGPVAEVVVYDGVLSDLERGLVNDYLGITRYALWGASVARLTELLGESLLLPTAPARLTSLAHEVIISPNRPAQLTALLDESLLTRGDLEARMTQFVRETLVTTNPISFHGQQLVV